MVISRNIPDRPFEITNTYPWCGARGHRYRFCQWLFNFNVPMYVIQKYLLDGNNFLGTVFVL